MTRSDCEIVYDVFSDHWMQVVLSSNEEVNAGMEGSKRITRYTDATSTSV